MTKWLVQRQKNWRMPKNQADFRSKKRGLLLNKKQKKLDHIFVQKNSYRLPLDS
jgi:hypothetical protein